MKPSWGGHREVPGGQDMEPGPDFLDASEAVQWWRDRGADQVFINLDGSEYLWAGVGPPPEDTMTVFSSDDPRGRHEDALLMAEAGRKRVREKRSLQRAQASIKLGEDLRRRRERTGLSVEELASRINGSIAWVTDVESGRTALEVDHNRWVGIVWATREPWPDERRYQPKTDDGKVRRYGWVDGEGAGLARAEESVRRWLEDDYGEVTL